MSDNEWQVRTELLVGREVLDRFSQSHVLVAGLGGVGGAAVEMLARASIGELTLVDADRIQLTNINRQILALQSNVGELKVEVARQRVLDINPRLRVHAISQYLEGEFLDTLLAQPYDAIIDAIDTISPKVYLIKKALEVGTPLVSSMGAGAKYDPTTVRVESFWKSSYCHLARTIRRRLRQLKIEGLETKDFLAVYSTEICDNASFEAVEDERNKKTRAGVISYIPNIFGCIAAGAVLQLLRDSIKKNPQDTES